MILVTHAPRHDFERLVQLRSLKSLCFILCTENSIRVDDVIESPKLAE